MATQTLGSVDLNHLLIEATTHFSDDIYRRTVDTSVWLKLIKQEDWPDGMGDTISVLTYERTLPAVQNTWDNINSSGTTFAVPSATTVGVSQTIRTYGLQHTAVESQNIVLNDVRFGFKFQEQLRAVYDNLVENVASLWQKRYRDEYRRLCGHKIVATLNNAGQIWDVSTEDYPVDVNPGSPTNGIYANIGTLTQGLLNHVYMQLIREGAGNHAMGRENGRPVFTLVCSAEASDALIFTNAGTRTDFRESSQVNELLKPLGVERSYRGFYHMVDIQAPRYNYLPAAPTTDARVETWDSVSKTGTVTVAELADIVEGMKFGFAVAGGDSGSVTKGVVIQKSAASGAGTFSFYASSAVDGASTNRDVTWLTYARDFSTSMPQGFVEVPLYVPDTSHTSSGPTATQKRWIVNPAYANATYEEAFILHPEVMRSLIPRPITNPGGNVKFDPVSYRGDFRFLNIPDRTTNPDGNHGYFRGILASGSKPCRPEFGYAIMYQRAQIPGILQRPTSSLVAASSALVETLGASPEADGQD